METIFCDDCKYEFDPKSIVFQEIVLNEADGTKMRFFQCPECKKEYIVDVTNAELRKKISIFKSMKRKYLAMYHGKASATQLRNYGEKLERVKNEIHTMQSELRKRWTSGT